MYLVRIRPHATPSAPWRYLLATYDTWRDAAAIALHWAQRQHDTEIAHCDLDALPWRAPSACGPHDPQTARPEL